MHCKDLAIVSIQRLQVPGLVASLAMTMVRGANNQHKSWRQQEEVWTGWRRAV